MGFKLGTSRQPYADRGEIKHKLTFKKDQPTVPGNPIIRVPLGKGIIAEANGPNHPQHPNSIYLNEKADLNSPQTNIVLQHEMRHLTAMKISSSKLSYTDNSITYEGDVYPRKDINGKDMIMDIHTGEWNKQAILLGRGNKTQTWNKLLI